MRRLALSLAGLLLAALPAWGAAAIAQWSPVVACANSCGTAATSTFAANVAAGDFIVILEGADQSSVAPMSLAGSGCAAATLTTYTDTGGNEYGIAVSTAVAGGPCSAVATVRSGFYGDLIAAEISGSTGVVDAQAFSGFQASAASWTASVTTSHSGDIVLAGVWTSASGASVTASGNLTIAEQHTSYPPGAAGSYLQTAAGTVTWSGTMSAAGATDSAIVALEPSAGAGPSPCPHTLATLGVGCS